MARPYSVDLRERVVRAVENGASRRATAAKFEVSISFVVKLMQRWRQRGTVQADPIGGWKRSTLAAHAERVRALVTAEPDLTIAELRSRLAAEGIATSRSSVGRFLAGAGITRKKSRCRRPSRTARTSPPRGAWRACQPDLIPNRLVFVDETWATTNMTRRYGRAPRGPRLMAAVPHGHWKTTTFMAALRLDGLTAPWSSTAR